METTIIRPSESEVNVKNVNSELPMLLMGAKIYAEYIDMPVIVNENLNDCVCQYLPVKLSVASSSVAAERNQVIPLYGISPIPKIRFSLSLLRKHWHNYVYPVLYRFASRTLDVSLSLFGLLVLSPLYVLVSILVKLDSPGPFLYKQTRVGQNRRNTTDGVYPINEHRHNNLFGKPFTIYKIRTMRADAEKKTGAVWTQEKDSRITRIGKFLRLTRFDETLQFINILKNDMKFIGPRPERPEFVVKLQKDIPEFGRRHNIKPGITGLAQVKYRYGASVADARRKAKYDMFYMKRRSIGMDLLILLMTLPTIMFGIGAR